MKEIIQRLRKEYTLFYLGFEDIEQKIIKKAIIWIMAFVYEQNILI